MPLMRSSHAPPGATSVFVSGVICAGLLVWLAVAGCNNTCVSFTSNPPTGTLQIKVSDSKVTCTLSRANGTVQVQIGTSPMPSPTLGSSSAQHIFVSVRGIDAHTSTVADDDSPDWQALAPQLARQPVQVDLMARPDPCAASPFSEAVLPAGVYRQIRLRFVPNQPATGERVPEVNACGSVGFNCVVRAGGSIQPLVLDGAAPQLRIAPGKIPGGSLLVLPDTVNAIPIEFNANLSLALPAGDAVRLVPVLTAARRAACESIDSF